MRCAVAVRDLGRVPARRLRIMTRDLPPERWMETELRQQRFRVHAATRSVVLLWSEHQGWPELTVHHGPRLAEFMPALRPVLSAAVARVSPEAEVANVMLAMLPAGAHIPPHVDVAPFFGACHRLHVPLSTHPGVRFMVDGQLQILEPSHLYEIDNRRPHAVYNDGPTDRVHLILDLLPPGAR